MSNRNKLVLGKFFLAETSDPKTIWIGPMHDGLPDGEGGVFNLAEFEEQVVPVIEKFYAEKF